MSKPLEPPSQAEIEAEAERLRDIAGDSDVLYAAYCALLYVLGYGVEEPSKLFTRKSRFDLETPITSEDKP